MIGCYPMQGCASAKIKYSKYIVGAYKWTIMISHICRCYITSAHKFLIDCMYQIYDYEEVEIKIRTIIVRELSC